jgi:uncharacterized membrane protein YeaQ/YmgE (transglycosylase-associated protein family)
MEWLTVGSWIVIGLVVGWMHLGVVRDERRGTLLGGAIFGALMGGYLVRLFGLPRLELHGYEIACLIGAAVCAEIGAVMVLGGRESARPRPHRISRAP